MGKVKIKKKETRIDMTAMSDVTVLLLTFFMLTSTFLQKEPVQVITPPSVSEKKVPDEKLMSVLISQSGKVFIELIGTKDTTQLKSEELRKTALMNAVSTYNELYPGSKVQLSGADVETFSKINAFGVPFKKLHQWLSMPTDERDKMLEKEGIPIKENFDRTHPTEFQIWVDAIYKATKEGGYDADMRKGSSIAIKADQATPYERVQVVMNNMQTIDMNKFTLMTALKKEE